VAYSEPPTIRTCTTGSSDGRSGPPSPPSPTHAAQTDSPGASLIFRETRNGVHPISGFAKNQATAMAFGGPRSSYVRPGAHSARRQDSRNDLTPCRMALHFVSAGSHAPHSDETPGPTATRGSSHSARRLRSLAFLCSSADSPQPNIFRFICVHSRSFAAKKKISSKPNGGHGSPYGRLSLCFQVSPRRFKKAAPRRI